MSPKLISSGARLKACSFSLVIPKIPSSSILIFLAIFAHLDVVVHLAYHQLLPIWMSVTLLTVEGEWNSKMPLAIFVLLTIGTLTLLILILLKFFMKQTDGALKQDCGGLTLTLEKRCHFPRRDWELFFLLSSGETRSWLSYDYSCISRRERDYILLLSCFETRSRFMKMISRGRARKNETDSRREFPGSRILLTSGLITLMNSFNWFRVLARKFGLWVLSPFLAKPQIYIFI